MNAADELSAHVGTASMFQHRGFCAIRRHGTSRIFTVLPAASTTSRLVPALMTNVHASQVRGKKTKTKVTLDDLPQGLVSVEPLQSLEPSAVQDEPAYPTVVLQAKRNMQKFSNCVLLTRVGGFYELYFEHADEYGPLLNIKVASKKTSAGPVPMVSSSRVPST